jgi:replicative superfamily II helicase
MINQVRCICGSNVQIVGMSATLPNMLDIAKWLHAALFITDYRPIELKYSVVVDRKLFIPIENRNAYVGNDDYTFGK